MAYVQVPPDSSGKKVDTKELTDGADTIERQVCVLAGGSGTAEVVVVTDAAPAAGDMGIVVRQAGTLTAVVSGTVNVNGGVAISGTAIVSGAVNISAMPAVTISGTATVAGSVVISGTATIAGSVVISGTAAVSAVIRTSGGTAVEDTTNNALRVNVVAGGAGGGDVVVKTSGGTAVEDQANNALRVNVVAGSSGGVSQVDGTTFSTQAANFIPIGGIYDDVATDPLSENDAGVVRMTQNRAFHVNLRHESGTPVDATAPLSVKVENVSATVTVVGTVNVNGGVAISGTAVVEGNVNISTMPAVALVAGTVINNISATVTVAGTVNVNGGVAISGTAIVAGAVVISGTATIAGSVGATIVNNLNISNTPSVVLAAGTAVFGTLNNISATVTVAGSVNISTMPAVNISNTPTVLAISRPMTTIAANSASRGPRTVIASTSANVTLVSAPGNGLSIFVTMVSASNASGTNTRGRFGSSATVGAVTQYMAQSGGGYVMQFNPPWEISANEALFCSVKPNASEGFFTAHFFVASSDAL